MFVNYNYNAQLRTLWLYDILYAKEFGKYNWSPGAVFPYFSHWRAPIPRRPADSYFIPPTVFGHQLCQKDLGAAPRLSKTWQKNFGQETGRYVELNRLNRNNMEQQFEQHILIGEWSMINSRICNLGLICQLTPFCNGNRCQLVALVISACCHWFPSRQLVVAPDSQREAKKATWQRNLWPFKGEHGNMKSSTSGFRVYPCIPHCQTNSIKSFIAHQVELVCQVKLGP